MSRWLLVMVPHRDVRLQLRAWSGSLFAAGHGILMPGAWSFPWVAPLAQLKRPLSGEELKSLARALREQLGSEKLTARSPGICPLPGESELSIFGPVLPVELNDAFFAPAAETIERRISPLVVGSALTHDPPPDSAPPPPPLSFRAAALANMLFTPLPANNGATDGYSFEWGIGPLHWLPGA